MKRIVIFCLISMFMVSAVASAEIKKDKDEMGLYVCSTIEKKDIGFSVDFEKNVVGEEVFYRVSAYVHSKFGEHMLKDKPISIYIDKYPAFYLDRYRYGTTDGYKEYYSAITDAEVSVDLINKIQNGKNVQVWCSSRNGMLPLFLASEDFLNEWKEVINTTE